MRIRDKDGNIGDVSVVRHEDPIGRDRGYFVGICADGLWLTPAQAMRFAAAIRRTADRVAKKKRTGARQGHRR